MAVGAVELKVETTYRQVQQRAASEKDRWSVWLTPQGGFLHAGYSRPLLNGAAVVELVGRGLDSTEDSLLLIANGRRIATACGCYIVNVTYLDVSSQAIGHVCYSMRML